MKVPPAPAKPTKSPARPAASAGRRAAKGQPVPSATKVVEKPKAKHSKPASRVTPKPAPAAKPAPAVKPAARTAAIVEPPAPAVKPPLAKAPGSAPAPRPAKSTGKVEAGKGGPKGHSTLRVEAAIPTDKDLSARTRQAGIVKDRIHLTAPDAYWLHVYWELSLQSVQRAEAALNQDWHGAKPIIRLCDVSSTDTTSTSEAIVKDIVVHGGCSHWYIDVPQPPRTYRADIGYLTRQNRFFALARSNVLTSPKAGASEALNGDLPAESAGGRNKAEEAAHEARFHAEDAFRRPLKENTFGTGAVLPGKLKKFFFDLDAELIVYVKTDPAATVTLQNEPVPINADGTATMRFSLPDSRQIIPAVATSGDGMEEQTIVLAVERNTKRLDPMIHDLYGDV